MEAQKLNLKLNHKNIHLDRLLLHSPQRYPKSIHTEHIIACFDIMWMWKPKCLFFYTSAVHVKLLLLADHKNCIWDDQINFQTTSTGQIRSSFEAQLNSPAELRQGNTRTMWAGHMSPCWPIRTLSFSKKRTDYLNVWEKNWPVL